MIGLGPSARVGALNASTLSVGSLQADSKSLGADPLNKSLLKHEGSLFYIKHSQLHQVDSLSVASASSNVLITTTANHGLAIGDTFHIDGSGIVDDAYELAGITKADLVGSHTALSVAADLVVYNASAFATADDFDNVDFLPLMQIDRYKYIDIVDESTTWSHSTVPPTPTRSNTIEPFFS